MALKMIALAAAFAVAAAVSKHDVERQQMIDEINGNTSLWTAGFNSRFAGTPVGSSADLCGVLPESLDQIIALRATQEPVSFPEQAIPESFDSEANWPECAEVIGDIRDQSNCGCCWAFGAAEAASDRLCISTKGASKLPLSAEDVCFCASMDGCSGGMLLTPWMHIKSKGVVTGGQYNNTGKLGGGFCSKFALPHCHHHGPQGNDPYPDEGAAGCPSEHSQRCPTDCDSDASPAHSTFSKDKYTFKGTTKTYQSETEIQQSIMNDGPVEAAFTVYTDFENYVSGVYHHVSGGMAGGHAIRIVGWGVDSGTKYWKVANSWNPYWGENGYFRIKRGTNECGIEEQVTASSEGATWAPMK